MTRSFEPPVPIGTASNGRRRNGNVWPPHVAAPSTTDSATPTVPWVRSEVLDACVVALRRMGGAKLRSVGVTSAGRGEGRSTVAAAMAVIQATEYVRKTIYIELDLPLTVSGEGVRTRRRARASQS